MIPVETLVNTIQSMGGFLFFSFIFKLVLKLGFLRVFFGLKTATIKSVMKYPGRLTYFTVGFLCISGHKMELYRTPTHLQ